MRIVQTERVLADCLSGCMQLSNNYDVSFFLHPTYYLLPGIDVLCQVLFFATPKPTEELSNSWKTHVPSIHLTVQREKRVPVLQNPCKMCEQNGEAIKKNLHLDDGLQETISHYLPSSRRNKTDLSTFLVHRWHINSNYKSTVLSTQLDVSFKSLSAFLQQFICLSYLCLPYYYSF